MKREGILALPRRMAGRTRYLLFQTTCSDWYVRTLSQPTEAVTPRLDVSVEFLVNDKNRLLQWLRLHNPKYSWMYLDEEIKAAHANGHIFATLFHSGEIIGYLKIGINRVYIHDFKQTVCFPPGTAFIYDTFVLPQYRKKHLASYGLVRAIDYLRDRKFATLWCHIEAWNYASIRMFTQAGFQKRCTLRFSKVLGLPIFTKNGYLPLRRVEGFIR